MNKTTTCLVLAITFLMALAGWGQVTTGTISGTVMDSSKAVLPGAKVVILNEGTGATRTATADASGRYAAPSLGLGMYRVTASLEGFQTEARTGIELTVGREAVVDIQLTVGNVSQSVEVTGEAPLVEARESTVSYLVPDRAIRDLPLNGRDLTELILMQPGVTEAINGKANSAYVGYGKRVSISGMKGEDNVYLLDGGYISDFSRHIPAGPSGALMGVETVREFQVLTNSFGAQYGRAMGGIFNAVSKSGNNEWHGDAYEFLRNSVLDARNFFDYRSSPGDPRLPPFRRNQFGGTFGGPIKKDKTFFFVAFESLRSSEANTFTANVPDERAHLGILPAPAGNLGVSAKAAPFLAMFPLPTPGGKNFGDGTAQYFFTGNTPSHDTFGQARVDQQLSASDSLFVRFTASGSDQSQPLAYPVFRQNRMMSTRLITLSETHIFSPRILNTVRFHFNRVAPGDVGTFPQAGPGVISTPGQPPPGISPGNGITAFEGWNKSPDYFYTNRFNYQDDVNLSWGNHSMQFGGIVERLRFNMNQPNRAYGAWTFNSLANFLQAIPSNYRGTPPQFGNSIRGYRQTFYALYLQDDWKVTPKLTLNLGVRWEPYTVPTEVNGLVANLRHLTDANSTLGNPFWLNKSMKDIGPRFGFAYSPFSSGKTAVRGGVGLFFVPNDPQFYFIVSTRVAPLFPEFNLATPTPATQQLFPDALAEIAAVGGSTNFVTGDVIPYDNFKSQRALQYNLSIQQQFGANNVLLVGYNGSRGMHLMSYTNYNMPAAVFDGVSLAFPANAVQPNPKFQSVNYFATGSNSWYNGLSVSFQRRMAKGLQTQLSYTYSKALGESDGGKVAGGNVGSGSFSPSKYPDPKVNKGLFGYDFRHVLSINFSYDLPSMGNGKGVAGTVLSGWQTTGILSVQTGQPFTVDAGTSPSALSALSVGTRSPNRVLGVPIIQGGPDQYFNPNAFSAPSARELGNVGMNTLTGPGLTKVDFGLTKNTKLTERFHLQFRAEFFNLLNHANFAVPAASLFTSSGSRVGSAGTIGATVLKPRQIQFGLKVVF